MKLCGVTFFFWVFGNILGSYPSSTGANHVEKTCEDTHTHFEVISLGCLFAVKSTCFVLSYKQKSVELCVQWKHRQWPWSFLLWPWTILQTSGSSVSTAQNCILLLYPRKTRGTLTQRSTRVLRRWRRSGLALAWGIYERHRCECETLKAAHSFSQLSARL